MIKRCITGMCLIIVVVGFFLLRNIDIALFEILVALLMVLGTCELLHALNDRIKMSQKVFSLLFTLLFTPVYHFFGAIYCLYMLILFVMGAFAYLVFAFEKISLESVALTIASFFYPTTILLAMLAANEMVIGSQIALVLIFIISPCSDTMAYVVGIIFKGKKLCPSLSPKKTVAGAIGGLIGGVVGSIVAYLFLRSGLPFELVPGIFIFAVVGLVGSVLTQFGDLVESVIKRKLSIKDMGKILPGHGGILDRIDGILFACPFIYVLVILFLA